ncbi:uncharacterized protein LOC131641907 [Vicia villosa]|uniref:uncharacterized protein LOC131641907 n=1 Tax=Vicia villosa TaxID=3911 RepID=UPI00273C3B5A|nr:uncharacterized protein LOC131641907 [Vicia villosa]
MVLPNGAATSAAFAAARGLSSWARFCDDLNSFIPVELEEDSFMWRINSEKEFSEIWKHMYGWVGIKEVLNGMDFLDFGVLQDKVNNVNHRLKLNIIWIAIIWCTWIMRNAIIFKGEAFCYDVVCSNIIFLSWRWLSFGYPKFKATYYEWFKFPLSCSNAF